MLQTFLKLTGLPKFLRELSNPALCEFSDGTQRLKILYEYWMSERNAMRECFRATRTEASSTCLSVQGIDSLQHVAEYN